MKEIYMNPFARIAVVRRKITTTTQVCPWCGQFKHTPKGKSYLYQYGIQSPTGRVEWSPKLFDSISCARDYGIDI